jgi:hypothetical protein
VRAGSGVHRGLVESRFGQPDLVQAFTAAEQSDADADAAAVGGIIERLPS